jgi:Arc/MetJ-type ribon-helix-helix transcriptional regulator
MEKKRISMTLTEPYLDALDRLVEEGVYVDRGEAVKDALRHLFRHYGVEPFAEPPEETRGP